MRRIFKKKLRRSSSQGHNVLRKKVTKSLEDDQEVTLQQIKMMKVPPALKKKGRPKGSDERHRIA